MMKEIRRAEKLRAKGVPDEDVPREMACDDERGVVTDDGDLVEPEAVWDRLRETIDPTLKSSVATAYPAYGDVLDRPANGWTPTERTHALGCIRLLIEIDPGLFAPPTDRASSDTPATVERITARCEAIGIDVEGDAFAEACEAVTGKRELDEMTPDELAKVAKGLEALATG